MTATPVEEVTAQIVGGEEEGRTPGRPPLSDEPTIRRTVTLPESYAVRIERLGRGKFSPGVRRALDLAEEYLQLQKAG